MEIQQLRTEALIGNPENPRRKIGDIAGLVASINAIGLLEPVVVREMDLAGAHDKPLYVIVSGARRVAACRELKHETIPCVIRADEFNEALASIAENTAREDLSVEDLAIAVNRLDGLSMSDEELSAALDISTVDVSHARLVSKASKKAKEELKKLTPRSRQFTLEESAVVVKYSEDKGRLEEIAETLEWEPAQLPHLIARFDDEDARDALLAGLRASMGKKQEIKPFNSWERPPKGAEPLHNLLASDGKSLTPARHGKCPNAGYLITNQHHGNPGVIHYCVDWEASGHKLSAKPKEVWRSENSSSSSGKKVSAKEAEKASAERKRVIANNKLWGPATTVRTAWLEEFCQRTELNAKAKKWVLEEIILEPRRISYSDFEVPAAFEVCFVKVFHLLISSRESDLKQATWRSARFSGDVFDRYFRMLQTQGYPVSEVEKNLIIEPKKSTKSSEADDEIGDDAA